VNVAPRGARHSPYVENAACATAIPDIPCTICGAIVERSERCACSQTFRSRAGKAAFSADGDEGRRSGGAGAPNAFPRCRGARTPPQDFNRIRVRRVGRAFHRLRRPRGPARAAARRRGLVCRWRLGVRVARPNRRGVPTDSTDPNAVQMWPEARWKPSPCTPIGAALDRGVFRRAGNCAARSNRNFAFRARQGVKQALRRRLQQQVRPGRCISRR